MPPTCQSGSGPTFTQPVEMFGTLPDTAVTQGLSSQAAVSGPALVLPHWLLAVARFCTTPQSPVPTSTGTLLAAAVSSAGSCAVISGWPWLNVASPVSSLIEITSARWRVATYSTPAIISGGATWLAASSVTSVSGGVTT